MVISEFLRGYLRSLSFSAALRIIALKSLRQILTPLLIIPHHCDSDAVLFVLRGESSINFIVNLAWTMHKLIVILLLIFSFFFSGKGTMTFVSQWKRESYSLERGDVMKVQAGVVGYLINPDDNEKISAAMLVNPVNTPGKFRVIRDYEFGLVILSDFMTIGSDCG